MRLTVNGKPREIDDASAEMALTQLLSVLEVNPRLVAVAINGDVIVKTSYDAAIVRDGDGVEIVRMVGGGCGCVGSRRFAHLTPPFGHPSPRCGEGIRPTDVLKDNECLRSDSDARR